MKKILFCVLGMIGTVTIVSAQETSTEKTTIQPPTKVEHIPVSHWSIGLKTGANYFIMAPPAPTRYDQLNLMVGGNIDYTINPLIGLGVEYNFNDYTRPYTYAGSVGHLKGQTQDAIFYGSVNLSNALSPFRSSFWRNLNVYGNIGGGLAFYEYDLNWGANRSNSTNAPTTMLANVGLNAEFTLSRSFNIGFEGQYRVYDTPRMAGCVSTHNNDAFIGTIGLRYKFSSSTKKHARNINVYDYSPKPVPVLVNKIVQGDTPETLNHLKSIEVENATLKQKIQDDAKNAALQKSLEAQNSALKQDLQKKNDDAANASIQRSLVTQNTTLQEKLQKMEDDLKALATQKNGVVNATFETIEFKSGSSQLTPSSTQLLDQISGILKNNSYWTALKVYGHTDNVGSSAYNQKLSESRALSVKKYMLNNHVSSSNIIAIGLGENKPIDTNDTAEGRQNNRRVEFEITK